MTQIMEPPARSENTPVVTRRFEPLAKIGTSGALKALLESQAKGIAATMPKHVTPERLIKTMLVAANRTPDLLECTQSSLLETINRAAELGLDLSGTLGEAYPVPFNNNVGGRDNPRWVKQCQLIIGYRGLVKLARQSGEVKRIEADVVCENDKFVFRKGSNATCEFEPSLSDRGGAVGAFAFVEFKDGGQQFDFMPFEDIEKVRRRSKAGSNKQGEAIGAWKSDWPEMAKKTVFRRVAKWLPLSTEKFVAALDHDDADTDFSQVFAAETGPRRSAAAEFDRQLESASSASTTSPAPASQQTAATSPAVEESIPRGHPSATLSPADSATDSSAGSRDAEDESHQQPEPPREDSQDGGKEEGSQTGPTDEAIDELVGEGHDKFKAALRAEAGKHASVSKTLFEGGLFKWLQANGKTPVAVPAAAWRSLWRAVADNSFDFSKGVISGR